MNISPLRVYTIFLINLKSWIRNKGGLFWGLLFPILLMSLFGSIFAGGDNTLDLHIQNLDITPTEQPTQASHLFIQTLNSSKAFNLHHIDPTTRPDAFMIKNNIARILIIPAGFQSSLAQGDAQIIYRFDASQTPSLAAGGIIKGLVDAFNTQVTGGRRLIAVQEQQTISTALRYIDFFLPGVLGMTILTTGVFGAITLNTKYYQNKVLRKLATTPLSKADWVLGVVLYQVLMAFISAALILIVGRLVFNVRTSIDIYTVLLLISGALAFPGMGMVFARFVRDEEAAYAAGNAVVFPMMFLSGTFFPIESMPAPLQPIATILPLTYLNNGLRDAMVALRPEGALANTMIMLITALIFIALGGLLTSWREE